MVLSQVQRQEVANITVDKRPLDCDFMHAPFGAKGCQYEKRTSVFGDEERQSLIRQATTTEEKQNASKQPNAVTVYWENTIASFVLARLYYVRFAGMGLGQRETLDAAARG